MYQYRIWIRINQLQTIHTTIMANNDIEAKLLAEAQYGQGNVLGYNRIYD
jgi:hypothetical protein